MYTGNGFDAVAFLEVIDKLFLLFSFLAATTDREQPEIQDKLPIIINCAVLLALPWGSIIKKY